MKKKIKNNIIIVKNQKELDKIPLDFKGIINIELNSNKTVIEIKNRYYKPVNVEDNSLFSTIITLNNSYIRVFKGNHIEARDNSFVEDISGSDIIAKDNSNIITYNGNVTAEDNSNVIATYGSVIEAKDNSNIEIFDWSCVEAYDNSNIIAKDWSQVAKCSESTNITISDYARIVPERTHDIYEFIISHNIKVTKDKMILYLITKLENQKHYYSKDKMTYNIECNAKKREKILCDIDKENDRIGIHLYPKSDILRHFLNDLNWKNISILEVETDIKDVICKNCDEIITSKVTVKKEIPLSECDLYGKVLLKLRDTENNLQEVDNE